jgi:hypothetical protein
MAQNRLGYASRWGLVMMFYYSSQYLTHRLSPLFASRPVAHEAVSKCDFPSLLEAHFCHLLRHARFHGLILGPLYLIPSRKPKMRRGVVRHSGIHGRVEGGMVEKLVASSCVRRASDWSDEWIPERQLSAMLSPSSFELRRQGNKKQYRRQSVMYLADDDTCMSN